MKSTQREHPINASNFTPYRSFARQCQNHPFHKLHNMCSYSVTNQEFIKSIQWVFDYQCQRNLTIKGNQIH